MSRVLIITPADRSSRSGNRVTANRWVTMLRAIGHQVSVAQTFRRQKCDVMIAMHAKHSSAAVAEIGLHSPETPVILMLTGTDLYRDIHRSAMAMWTVESADRLVALQDRGGDSLPPLAREKLRVIYQSAERPAKSLLPLADVFEVCVAGHLRAVKDPFRAEMASRQLPPESQIRIVHVGDALTPAMRQKATHAVANNPRYRWLGSQTRARTRQLIGRSRVVVISSKMEGGANVIAEALVAGTSVLASRISGNVGMLGDDYSGYFELGNTSQLCKLLERLENEDTFRRELHRQCKARAALFAPSTEIAALRRLLSEIGIR
jgi:putative glycosyltransferase (TIGR04348 family)